jgi:hypothetical protein
MYIFIVSMAVIVQLYVFMQSSVLLSYHLKFVILTREQNNRYLRFDSENFTAESSSLNDLES